MVTTRITLLIILFFAASCAQPKNETDWIRLNTTELKTKNGYDFSSLKEAIGNKRIVALGESTHGSGTYYTLKSEIVKYLHDEMGFEVLAMESGLGDTYLAYEGIDTINSNKLRDFSVFGNFRAKEASPLFEYIKSRSNTESPLNYVGYDTQASSEFMFELLSRMLMEYDKELSDSLVTRMRSYQRSYGYGHNHDSINYQKHRDIFVQTSRKAERYLTEHKNAIISKYKLKEKTHAVLLRTLSMFSSSYNLPYQQRWLGISLRDSLMAKNIDWLINDIYPDKKFIIWAHNSHVNKGGLKNSNIKWMGNFLKEKYQDNYYTIGIFANSGEVYQYWTDRTIQIQDIDTSFIEHRLMTSKNHTAFLDLNKIEKSTYNNWIYSPVNAFELENGGVVNFIPSKRFDGIIVAKKSEPTTYRN